MEYLLLFYKERMLYFKIAPEQNHIVEKNSPLHYPNKNKVLPIYVKDFDAFCVHLEALVLIKELKMPMQKKIFFFL